MSDNNFHSDPIMRLTAQRAARAAAGANEVQDAPRESRSVTMVIYAWAAIGLVAFGVATTSLVTVSADQSPELVAEAPELPASSSPPSQTLVQADEEFDLITTSSVNVEPTVPAIVNIYPRSHKPEQSSSSHGAQIGSASDVDGLVATFTALEKRSPELLKDLNPLIRFDNKGSQIAANLIAGPFNTPEASEAFCDSVKTNALLPCTPSAYQGDPLLGD